MRRTTYQGLALAAVLALGVTACSSSGSKPSANPTTGGPTASGASSANASGHPVSSKVLVVEDNPSKSFVDYFNPFDAKSVLGQENAISLFYEPLMQFNFLDSSSQPIPWLATKADWTDGNKTLTFTLASGVKWSDGQPFTSADVKFTFDQFAKDSATNTGGAPVPTSVDAPDPQTVVMKFAAPQSANFPAIANQWIVPEHIWSKFTDKLSTHQITAEDTVGTGPFVLDKFSPQNVTLKANPSFRLGLPAVQHISLPAYGDNNAATLALSKGDIDLTGNDINDVLNTFVAKDPANYHLFQTTAPYYPANNTVVLLMNQDSTNAPALKDVAVRKAISAALDRQSMATQCETNYEKPASSSGGLVLPMDSKALDPSLANDLKPASDPDTVTSLLTADGYAKGGDGKWAKGGATIKFTIIDPNTFTDYWCDAQAMVTTLNGLGFDTRANGAFDYPAWNTAITTGNYDTALHWGNGNTPFQHLQFNLDSTLSAPNGKVAAQDFSHYKSADADAAITAFENSTTPADGQTALNSLQQLMSKDVPAVPVLYGAAWYQYNSKNFTGWPTIDNPYISPAPRSQDYEYMILHLTPKS